MTKLHFALILFSISFSISFAKTNLKVNDSNSEIFEFKTLLFCENDRKSIIFVSISSKSNSISKITPLAYFSDSYPNDPSSNFYSTSKSSFEKNKLFVDLNVISGVDAKNLSPEFNQEPSQCEIELDSKWFSSNYENKEKTMFSTNDFKVLCRIKGTPELGKCTTNQKYEESFYLYNPIKKNKIKFLNEFNFFK